MEVKLSQDEVKEIATEVIRLMKQEGLITSTAANPSPEVKNAETATKPTSGNKPSQTAKGIAPPQTSARNKAVTSASTPPAAELPADDSSASTQSSTTASTSGVYTIGTAAKYKGYHPNTIRRAIKAGKLNAKLDKDGKYQIKQRDLDKFAV